MGTYRITISRKERAQFKRALSPLRGLVARKEVVTLSIVNDIHGAFMLEVKTPSMRAQSTFKVEGVRRFEGDREVLTLNATLETFSGVIRDLERIKKGQGKSGIEIDEEANELRSWSERHGYLIAYECSVHDYHPDKLVDTLRFQGNQGQGYLGTCLEASQAKALADCQADPSDPRTVLKGVHIYKGNHYEGSPPFIRLESANGHILHRLNVGGYCENPVEAVIPDTAWNAAVTGLNSIKDSKRPALLCTVGYDETGRKSALLQAFEGTNVFGPSFRLQTDCTALARSTYPDLDSVMPSESVESLGVHERTDLERKIESTKRRFRETQLQPVELKRGSAYVKARDLERLLRHQPGDQIGFRQGQRCHDTPILVDTEGGDADDAALSLIMPLKTENALEELGINSELTEVSVKRESEKGGYHAESGGTREP